jgi:hypothetical protein
MTPVSTAPTDIDEIIILRKAKRLNSNVRAQFSTAAGRAKHRDSYVKFLKDNPFSQDMFERLLLHVRELISNKQPDEKNVLSTGFF